MTGRWFTDDMGREIDLDCFTSEAGLRAALGRPGDDFILTDAGGRNYAPASLFPRTPAPARPVAVAVAGRGLVCVPAASADRFAGLDGYGNRVYRARAEWGANYLVPMTQCCHATGKGADSPTGVVCRRCHAPVDGYYGGPAQVAWPRLGVGDVVTVTPQARRQFDIVALDTLDGMVQVAPRRPRHAEDGPRWVSVTYVRVVTDPAAHEPYDTDDEAAGPAGPYTTRPAHPGEAGPYGWVVQHADGEAVAAGTQEISEIVARALNDNPGRGAAAVASFLHAPIAGGDGR